METLCEIIQEGGKTDGGQRKWFKELHFVQNKENWDIFYKEIKDTNSAETDF